ncbi:hypothetical protein Tco_1039752 [Tanacetum coccineum]
MADNRTMAQMLQAPIEGYEDAIVVPPINANNFELKQPLINLVQSNKFTGRQDPHNHLRFFNKVTSTFRHPEVPNTSIKLLLFPFSLDGEARDWLDKEPPRSILTSGRIGGRKANCLLAGSCMSGNVHVRLREKGGGQKWPCCTSLLSSMGSALSFLGEKDHERGIKGLESIYDPEFPDTSHFCSGRGCHSALRRIKEEWGTSRWFLEFDIRKCFHTIDRHRLIPIFKEEIGDPSSFTPIRKVFSAGRHVGGEGPYLPSHTVIRSVLLRTCRIDDQEGSREEASFNPPQDNRAIIVGRVKSIQSKAAFHSLVLSWHTPPTSTPRLKGDQKRSFAFPSSLALAAFLNKPSSLLCTAFLIEAIGLTLKAEFYGREHCNNNWAMRDFFKYCKRKGLLIELGEEAILVIRSERGLARKLAPLKSHYLIRICYARYADDLLLGIVGAVELLIEIKKLLAHFLQFGLNLWVGSAGSTTIAARSTVEFLGTVIREVPPRTTPIQFLRELEKRL